MDWIWSGAASYIERPLPLAERVLLVTAHPDDEAMFFAPTLQGLKERGSAVSLLCLSTGNADGLGKIREKEILRSAEKLRVDSVHVVDDPRLQDGMDVQWEAKVIADIVQQHVLKGAFDMVLSFDQRGVSSHPNHCDVHKGIAELSKRSCMEGVSAWQLETVSLVRKFSGALDLLTTFLIMSLAVRWPWSRPPQAHVALSCCHVARSYGLGCQAMKCHRTQMVW